MSLNLDFGGFVSLIRIVGLQAKVVCKNSRLSSFVAARDFSPMKIKVSQRRGREETPVFTANARMYMSFISHNGKLMWRAVRGSLIGRN